MVRLVHAQVVEVTAVDAATGAGIPKIGINLEQVTTGAYRVYQGRTDSDGHYRFENIQDGKYRVMYATNDYYWTGETRGDQQRFEMISGAAPIKLIAHMSPLPHLSGRVVDGRGDPVPGARVDIDGKQIVFTTDADASGKFDLHWRPGTYTLSAVAPASWKPPDPEEDTGRALGWARTYYPGTAVADAATKIQLHPGMDLADLVIKLRAVPVHAVRGVLLNPEGAPMPKQSVVLQEGRELPWKKTAQSDAEGAFEFPDVPDGDFLFYFEASRGSDKLRADQWITVAGRDLENVKLRLEAPFAVSGKLVFEKPEGASVLNPRNVELVGVTRDHPMEFPMVLTASVNPQSEFKLAKVYPGVYRLDVSPPPPYYLDRVWLGDVELPAMELQLSGTASLTLQFRADGGTARGTAEKCNGGVVLLIPVDPVLRAGAFLRNTVCDSQGRYQMSAVRPGDYYTLAFAASDPPIPVLPHWDDSTLNTAAKVTVRPGETTSLDLRAIAAQ